MKELETYRQQSKKSEEDLKETHRNEIVALNSKLDELNGELTSQIDLFEAAYKKFEKEKSLLTEDLKTKHRQEIDRLEEKYSSNKDALKQERAKLAEKYEAELIQLRSELEESGNRANREKQEYEANLSKLKAFHDRELEACKQNSSSEYLKLIDVLKANMEAMKKQKQSDDAEFSNRYNRKLEELVTREEEIKTLTDQLNELKSNLEKSDQNFGTVNQKVKKKKRLKRSSK